MVHDEEVYADIRELLYIPKDEPIFIIRAKDQVSVLVLMNYLAHAKKAGCSNEFLAEIAHIGNDFTDWRLKNPGKVKVPD